MSVMPPRGSTVAIYARYSTDMQSPTSLDGQIRLCEQYAAERGWVTVTVHFIGAAMTAHSLDAPWALSHRLIWPA